MLPPRPHDGGGGGFGGGGQNMQAPQFWQERQADPLVQAEVLRLQRLQMGLASVDEQEQNKQLEPEEANAFRLQLRSGINPLMARQQAAQTRALNEQTQQAMHQHAQLVAMQTMSAEQLAEQADRMVRTVYDDEGNPTGTVHFDAMSGRSTFHEARQERTGRDRQEITPQMRQQAIRHVEGQMAREEANQVNSPSWMTGEAATRAQRRTVERARRLREHLQEITGGGSGTGGAGSGNADEQARNFNAALNTNATVDPGRIQGSPQETSFWQNLPGMPGQASPYTAMPVTGVTNRLGPGDVFREMRQRPRVERGNEAVGITYNDVQRVLNVAGAAWNNSSNWDRAHHGQLKKIGRMVDLLNNVRLQNRHLNRQEYDHYEYLRRELSEEDQRAMALPAPSETLARTQMGGQR